MGEKVKLIDRAARVALEHSQPLMATDTMMREINSLPGVRTRLSAEDVIVHGMEYINDRLMHESSYFVRRFDAPAVHQAQRFVLGKPIQANHDTAGAAALPLGRIFRADGVTVDAYGVNTGRALFYMVRNEEGLELDRKIRSGIVSEVSPTVIYDRTYCSICGANGLDCEHVPGKLYEAGRKCVAVMTGITDIHEVSLVWSGQQVGTTLYEAASRGHTPAGLTTAEAYFGLVRASRGGTGHAPAVSDKVAGAFRDWYFGSWWSGGSKGGGAVKGSPCGPWKG